MSTVLVTGADGMVGSAVVTRLRSSGHKVVCLEGDAREPAAVKAALDGVDAVAHCAAIADPGHEPLAEIFVNNTIATFTVLWTAAEHGVRRFVIASSAHATGLSLNPHRPPVDYPITEDTPADIADPYSMAKQTDENMGLGRLAGRGRGVPARAHRRVRGRARAARGGADDLRGPADRGAAAARAAVLPRTRGAGRHRPRTSTAGLATGALVKIAVF